MILAELGGSREEHNQCPLRAENLLPGSASVPEGSRADRGGPSHTSLIDLPGPSL